MLDRMQWTRAWTWTEHKSVNLDKWKLRVEIENFFIWDARESREL